MGRPWQGGRYQHGHRREGHPVMLEEWKGRHWPLVALAVLLQSVPLEPFW